MAEEDKDLTHVIKCEDQKTSDWTFVSKDVESKQSDRLHNVDAAPALPRDRALAVG